MSAVKSGLIGAAAVGGVIAVLFASGTVKLSGSEDDSVAQKTDEAEATEKKKGAKKRRRRGRKGRKRGKGQDLRSLGYLAESRPEAHRNKAGVTVHDKERAAPGYALYNYCGWGAGLAGGEGDKKPWGDSVLLSLEGEELHRWHTDLFGDRGGGVSISKLLPGGDLVINRADLGVARIGFDSETIWQLEGVYHHDLAVEDDESVWVMSERRLETEGSRRGVILDHGLTHISKAGEVLRTLWFSDILADEPNYQRALARVRSGKGRGDLQHANAVEILAADGPDGLWKKGDILSSIRNMNMLVVVERETGKLLWSWGKDHLQHQHGPVLTQDGKFLVFDNGHRRRRSRLLEIDPLTKEIGWTYEGTPSNPFFSGTRGTVQELSGGMVFVGSSNDGRMFQVDREGEIVWEYWTKDKARGKVVPIRAQFVTGSLKEAIDARLALGGGVEAKADPPAETTAGEDESSADGDDSAAASDEKPVDAEPAESAVGGKKARKDDATDGEPASKSDEEPLDPGTQEQPAE
ncbi:MAG: arylsulfotransferase family protein [Nannocystaceae bacterium]|nr:arylsulfotransferase family protein [Nannocystaceae bacterium]